jgi:hypothetical protein
MNVNAAVPIQFMLMMQIRHFAVQAKSPIFLAVFLSKINIVELFFSY